MTMQPCSEPRSLRRDITERLVASMRAGTTPWQKPWSVGQSPMSVHPFNPVTGTRYSGINRLTLSLASFKDNRWLTLKQIESRGLSLSPGSVPERIVFCFGGGTLEEKRRKDESHDGGFGYKWHEVYNGSDIVGLDVVIPPFVCEPADFDVSLNVIAVLAASGANLIHGGDRACYRPSPDTIHLPWRRNFHSTTDYSSTALHELAHWSGHPSRLDRNLSGRFGSDAYAIEELHAEIASAFLVAELGLGMTQHQIDAHASYLNSWCRVLERDERAVQIVASGAQRITDYLLSFAPRRLELPGKPSEPHSTQYRQRAAKKKRPSANDVPVPIATA